MNNVNHLAIVLTLRDCKRPLAMLVASPAQSSREEDYISSFHILILCKIVCRIMQKLSLIAKKRERWSPFFSSQAEEEKSDH